MAHLENVHCNFGYMFPVFAVLWGVSLSDENGLFVGGLLLLFIANSDNLSPEMSLLNNYRITLLRFIVILDENALNGIDWRLLTRVVSPRRRIYLLVELLIVRVNGCSIGIANHNRLLIDDSSRHSHSICSCVVHIIHNKLSILVLILVVKKDHPVVETLWSYLLPHATARIVSLCCPELYSLSHARIGCYHSFSLLIEPPQISISPVILIAHFLRACLKARCNWILILVAGVHHDFLKTRTSHSFHVVILIFLCRSESRISSSGSFLRRYGCLLLSIAIFGRLL